MKWRRKLLIAATTVTCAVGFYSQLNQFLCGGDAPEKSDAVIVLAGGRYTLGRLTEGLRLFHEGYATNLIVSGVEFNPQDANYIPATEPLLARLPVEVDGESKITRGSSLLVSRLATERRWQRVIVVTSAFHWRRTRALFHYDCPGGLDVRVCTVKDVDFRGWRQDHYNARLLRSELLYFCTFYLFHTPYGAIVIGLLVAIAVALRKCCGCQRRTATAK